MNLHGQLLETHAELVATVAHSAIDQRRKYTNDAYIVHPRAVVELVKSVPYCTSGMIAMAWLHDVVEDTHVTGVQIAEWFGAAIADGVWHLTNPRGQKGNRRERFEQNLARLKNANPQVKTIKVADLIDNTSTIVQHDPKFAKLYLSEKLELLDRALRDANERLWQDAWDQCREAQAGLE